MYKISIRKQNAKKRLVSIEKYATIDDAENAINKHIENQYSDCCRAWGMTAVEKKSSIRESILRDFQSGDNIYKTVNFNIHD